VLKRWEQISKFAAFFGSFIALQCMWFVFFFCWQALLLTRMRIVPRQNAPRNLEYGVSTTLQPIPAA
jgi:hypothetical protein